MTKLGISLFDLGYMQVLKEKRAGKKIKNIMLSAINKAVRIRHYLDLKDRGEAIAKARKNNLV
jgi:hypothetical protein